MANLKMPTVVIVLAAYSLMNVSAAVSQYPSTSFGLPAVTKAIVLSADDPDTTAPLAPSIPDMAEESDTGSSTTDNVTMIGRPHFTGTAEAESTVTLYLNDLLLSSTRATSEGVWSFTPSANIADGIYKLSCTATDASTNTSELSPELFFTIDTLIPVTPSGPDLDPLSDNGFLHDDNITNDNTPTVFGLAEENATVVVFLDSEITTRTPAGGDGVYLLSLEPALQDGDHDVYCVAQDLAGNMSTMTAVLAIQIDTAITTPSQPDMPVFSDYGTSWTDNLTNNAQPFFEGTAEPFSMVTLVLDGEATSTVETDENGVWDFLQPHEPIPDGTHSVVVNAADVAGNSSDYSTTLSIMIDTQITTPTTPDLTSLTDRGVSSTDNLTNGNVLEFQGTAEAYSTVSVMINDSNVVDTKTDSAGVWTVSHDSFFFNGPQSVKARSVDDAGNVSPFSEPLVVAVDVQAPTAELETPVPNPRSTPVSSLDVTFSEPAYGITPASFTLLRNQTTVSLSGAQVTGGPLVWSLTNLESMTAPDGSYELSIVTSQARDLAGNEAWASLPASWITTSFADLSMVMTPDTSSTVVGTTVTYTVTIENHGESDATNINGFFTATPDSAMFLGADVTHSSNSIFLSNALLVIDSIQAGESVTFHLYAAASDPGEMSVTGVCYATQPDFTTGNNTAIVSIAVGEADGPDLSGSDVAVTMICKDKNGSVACLCKVKLSITNRGNAPAGKSLVSYYLSNDAVLDQSDILLKTTKLKALKPSKIAKAKAKFKPPVEAFDQFLLIAVDPADSVAEANELNNVIWFPLNQAN